jgi:hypothetical protein
MSFAIPTVRSTEFDLTIVVEHSGKISRLYQGSLLEPSSLQTIVQNLLFGRYIDPIRVLAFNKARRRSRDISKDVAEVVLRRALREGKQVPDATRGFIEYHLTKAIGAEVNLMRLTSGPFLPIKRAAILSSAPRM